MKNDYKRTQFWTTKVNNNTHYFIRLNGNLIKVTKQVYAVCRNSYQKMYRDSYKENNYIPYLEDREYVIQKYFGFYNTNLIDFILMKDKKEVLKSALLELNDEEYELIDLLYFQGKSERDIAKKFNLTQPAIHYKKDKILKKLKKSFIKYI